jgi:hypothetical protein
MPHHVWSAVFVRSVQIELPSTAHLVFWPARQQCTHCGELRCSRMEEGRVCVGLGLGEGGERGKRGAACRGGDESLRRWLVRGGAS